MTITDIMTPDNPADILVHLRISGNRLVSICNTCQGLMHEGNKLQYPYYAELNEVIERVRDQLSAQRIDKR
jgi:hypothetical protein